MTSSKTAPVPGLPPWLVLAGSLLILGHLGAVAALVLAAPSGPWPTDFGNSMAVGPQFARSVSDFTTPRYLTPLKMNHDYHFSGNRPSVPGARLEFRLKDEAGRHLKTVRVPDDTANFWVRHRQTLLALALTPDQPVQPPAGEVIMGPNQTPRFVAIWEPDNAGTLHLRRVAEHLVPRNRPVFRPSEWSLVLTRSYARHLCRLHGAASAEVVRYTREPVLPAVLFLGEPSVEEFSELVSNYGELPR